MAAVIKKIKRKKKESMYSMFEDKTQNCSPDQFEYTFIQRQTAIEVNINNRTGKL